LVYNEEHLIGKEGLGLGKTHPKFRSILDDGDDGNLTPNGLTFGGVGRNEVKVEKAYLLSLMFARFDANHNGALDYAELQEVKYYSTI